MTKLQLAVVTAEGESFSGEVDAIVAPGEVGESRGAQSETPCLQLMDNTLGQPHPHHQKTLGFCLNYLR